MDEKGWEHFYHQADIGIRGMGDSIEEAFEQAAIALTAVITDPAKIAGTEKIQVSCNCRDRELLFVDWLNALIYETATRKMLFARFEVSIEDADLRADIWGEPIDTQKHQAAVEVKAATYNSLKVSCNKAGLWVAQCVVDV